MKALQLYAGPKARSTIAMHGLRPSDICTIPAAAGGPKGLLLGPLDRFLFGEWLPRSTQPIDLVGASIGAWRMATACLDGSVAAFERLEHDYIHQHYELAPGQKRPTAAFVSETFGKNLQAFYGGRVSEVLNHPRFALHIVTSRGRHLLNTEHSLRTPLGYAGAFFTNAVRRTVAAGTGDQRGKIEHAIPGDRRLHAFAARRRGPAGHVEAGIAAGERSERCQMAAGRTAPDGGAGGVDPVAGGIALEKPQGGSRVLQLGRKGSLAR